MKYTPFIILLAIIGAVGAVYWPGTGTDSSLKYAKLFFGPDKQMTLIAELDGDKLRFIENAQTDAKSTFHFVDDSLEANSNLPCLVHGATSFQIKHISRYEIKSEKDVPGRHALMIHVDVKDSSGGETVEFEQYCDVALSNSKKTFVEEAHFDGPLEIGPFLEYRPIGPKTSFKIQEEPIDFKVVVGTFELDKTWNAVVSGTDDKSRFKEGVFPAMVVEYPTADPNLPITVSYDLDQFC